MTQGSERALPAEVEAAIREHIPGDEGIAPTMRAVVTEVVAGLINKGIVSVPGMVRPPSPDCPGNHGDQCCGFPAACKAALALSSSGGKA